ncbi:MAG: hypothetical protein RL095_2995 [Verrucomicrobiota bacterium]|jgi:hypothetical protein
MKLPLCVLTSLFALSSCHSSSKTAAAPASAPDRSITSHAPVTGELSWEKTLAVNAPLKTAKIEGKTVVYATPAAAAAIAAGQLPASSITHPGQAPDGKDLVVEADPQVSMLHDRLYSAVALYQEVESRGRTYVLGSPASRRSFEETHEVPYSRTFIGDGIKGETVVVEHEKDGSLLSARLIREYARRHGKVLDQAICAPAPVLPTQIVTVEDLRQLAAFKYRVLRKPGQIILVGGMSDSPASSELRPKAGPGGEDVVVETHPRLAHWSQELWSQFALENLTYHEVAANGRVYVLGSLEALKNFQEAGEIPYTKTFLGEGVQGETVVFETGKDSNAIARRLMAEFNRRRGKTLKVD